MAGHSSARRRQLGRLLLVVLIILAAGLTRTLFMIRGPNEDIEQKKKISIQGRWKFIRSTYGLPPLSDTIELPIRSIASPKHHPFSSKAMLSRFDLKRKRSMEQSSPSQLQLHFAADTLQNPGTSLKQLSSSFRNVALLEKGIAEEQARVKQHRAGQRMQRRPPGWPVQTAKLSDGG